jgi:hypothetical protein
MPTEPMDMPTQAQLRNGGYERKFVTHVETNTKAMAFVSSHDPVERWLRDGRLSDAQEVAIGAVRRLWRLSGISQKVTATYGERCGGGSAEYQAINEIEAREDLHRMQGYIPKPYWDVWENVCRHGMPAGVAGAELGYGTRSAQDRAHHIVCFVADTIAMMERW